MTGKIAGLLQISACFDLEVVLSMEATGGSGYNGIFKV
jgi:hypothetical protein